MTTVIYALSIMATATIATGLIMWLIVSTIELFDVGYEDSPNWSFYRLVGTPFVASYKASNKVIYRLTHRPSPLQREIMQEEKEIKELERQKADMERLDQLRERKKKLFEEVKGDD